jgi:hypothetical protein
VPRGRVPRAPLPFEGVILEPGVDALARTIGKMVADREVGLLVGAGLSTAVQLPSWSELLRRLVLLRFRAGSAGELGGGSFKQFDEALRDRFDDPLVLAEALRVLSGTAFEADLRAALYGPEAAFHATAAAAASAPVPRDPSIPMLHLVALADTSHGIIHTLNFDDMLERAAQRVVGSVRSLTPDHPLAGGRITIAHLHGLLRETGPGEGLVLTDRQFNVSKGEQTRWPQRELLSLFESRSVLMIGIGTSDPDVRAVLDVTRPTHKHFMLRVMPGGSGATVRMGNAAEARLWSQRSTDFVALRHWNEVVAFLVAVRHYTYEAVGQDAWLVGHRRLIEALGRSWSDLWKPQVRTRAQNQLVKILPRVRSLLGIPAATSLKAGIFVPNEAGRLDLPFRSDAGSVVAMSPGYRVLDAAPAAPQGVAGLAYASGALVLAKRGSEPWDYGFDASKVAHWSRTTTGGHEAVACAPVFDWEVGHGEPLGVGYVSASDPAAFDAVRTTPDVARVLEEVLLGDAMAAVLHSLRKGAA